MVAREVGAQLTFGNLVLNQKCRIPILRFLNVFIKNSFAKMGYQEIGRNKIFYNPKRGTALQTSSIPLRVVTAFKTSVEIYEGGLKTLINPVAKIFHENNIWTEY